MTCVTAVAPGFRFVSGADEKVLRVFEAPTNFLDAAGALSGVRLGEEERKLLLSSMEEAGGAVVGAAVPALGLSNKAIRRGEAPDADALGCPPDEIIPVHGSKGLVVFPPAAAASSASSGGGPPLETDLLQNTLWPEAQKLYDHGNPIFCVASSADGRVVASASKAAKPEEATVLLWGGTDRQWRHMGAIGDAHSLTVTQMAFSKTWSDETVDLRRRRRTHRLLSVSRDRTIVVTEIVISVAGPDGDDNDDSLEARVIFKTTKNTSVHARIIWSCDWAHDDSFFLTASRDKKVVAWAARGGGDQVTTTMAFESLATTSLDDACTAVACASRCFRVNAEIGGISAETIAATTTAPPPTTASTTTNCYLSAVGLDSGAIMLFLFVPSTKVFRELVRIPQHISHHLTVKRLQFRPRPGRAGDRKAGAEECGGEREDTVLQLASCSADGFVRVYEIAEKDGGC